MRGGNYQDNITQPLSRDHDNDAVADGDPDVINADLNPAMRVLSAVERVSLAYLFTQFKLRQRALLAPKDCQGRPFKSSMSPILGT
jgi:hypothetical protein